jgi:hypothetical protein
MSLAEQLIALCKEHGLNALSVEVHVAEDREPFFGCYAHADGMCGSSTMHRDTPSDAVSEAIADVQAKRGKSLVDVPVLEAA